MYCICRYPHEKAPYNPTDITEKQVDFSNVRENSRLGIRHEVVLDAAKDRLGN
jgi:hypothetical protein